MGNRLASAIARLGLAACACAEPAPVFLGLPELEPTVGFLLAFDQLDAPPVSVSAPFELGGGLLSTAELVAREDQTLLLLTLDDAAIAGTGVRRLSVPASAVRLELEPEACPAGRLDRSLDPPRLSLPVRGSARAHLARLPAPQLVPTEIEAVGGLSRARLSFPIEPGGCPLVSPEQVHDYDPSHPELLYEGAVLRGQAARPRGFIPLDLVHLQVQELGPNRVLGVSPRELLLYVRGEPFQDLPERRRSPLEVPGLNGELTGEGESWTWRSAAVLNDERPGRGVVVAAATLEVGGDDARSGFRSALVEIGLDERGLTSARTATVWTGEIRDVLLGEDGRVFALWNESGSERGSNRSAYVLRAPGLDGPWETHRISREVAARTLVATTDPDRPHAVGLVLAQLLLGDLDGAPPALAPVTASWTAHTETITSRGRGDDLTLWVGTERGELVRVEPTQDRVTSLPFRIPLEASACGVSVDDCGWPRARERFLSLHYLPELDALGAMLQACEALLLFRVEDLCPSAIAFPGASRIGDSRAARAASRTERGLLFFEPSSRAAELGLR